MIAQWLTMLVGEITPLCEIASFHVHSLMKAYIFHRTLVRWRTVAKARCLGDEYFELPLFLARSLLGNLCWG